MRSCASRTEAPQYLGHQHRNTAVNRMCVINRYYCPPCQGTTQDPATCPDLGQGYPRAEYRPQQVEPKRLCEKCIRFWDEVQALVDKCNEVKKRLDAEKAQGAVDNLSAAMGGMAMATREAQRTRQEQRLRSLEHQRDSMEDMLKRMDIGGPPGENGRRMRYGQNDEL